jgi:hypothetical protein
MALENGDQCARENRSNVSQVLGRRTRDRRDECCRRSPDMIYCRREWQRASSLLRHRLCVHALSTPPTRASQMPRSISFCLQNTPPVNADFHHRAQPNSSFWLLFDIKLNRKIRLLNNCRPSSSFQSRCLRDLRHWQNMVLAQLVSANGSAIFNELMNIDRIIAKFYKMWIFNQYTNMEN